jgi:hypothetical protein
MPRGKSALYAEDQSVDELGNKIRVGHVSVAIDSECGLVLISQALVIDLKSPAATLQQRGLQNRRPDDGQPALPPESSPHIRSADPTFCGFDCTSPRPRPGYVGVVSKWVLVASVIQVHAGLASDSGPVSPPDPSFLLSLDSQSAGQRVSERGRVRGVVGRSRCGQLPVN